jgi:hypothetical protein
MQPTLANRMLQQVREKDQAQKVENLKKSEANVEFAPRGLLGSNERKFISVRQKLPK